MAASPVSSPVCRDDDDDPPRRFNIRVGSPRSSGAEANRRRRSTATHRNHLRGSRASPPDPNRNRGRRLSGDNAHRVPGGNAGDRLPRCAWVSNGEENGDHMTRRRAGVSDDQRGDDIDSRRRKRSLSDTLTLRSTTAAASAAKTGTTTATAGASAVAATLNTIMTLQLNWDALKKSIHGLVNKVNAAGIKDILPELFALDLVRGRGIFCESCIESQMASPDSTDVFAALVAAVNSKFPEVGRLLLVRVMLQLKSAHKQSNKPQLVAATKFIAHLVNQAVAHEMVALELVTMFLENPTEDSVEVAVGFVRECGAMLRVLSPQRLSAIFERFRGILDGGEVDKRVQFLIEGFFFSDREARFKGFPATRPELVFVVQRDQFTHEISLQDELDPKNDLNVLRAYPSFHEDDEAYENLRRSIQGSESSENAESFEEQMEIWTNSFNKEKLRLTIMCLVFVIQKAGLMKINLRPGQEMELCRMIIEFCREERTYLRYFGLLAQRYCMMRKAYQENFEKCFVQEYSSVHCLEIQRFITVAKFFAHLLETDTLPWHIQLTEEATTSSSRIFVMILFRELAKRLGIRLLEERLSDLGLQGSLKSIFRKDHPKNTRFSISFFTEGLKEHLLESMRQHQSGSECGLEGHRQSDSESTSDSWSESESSSDGSYYKRRKRIGF